MSAKSTAAAKGAESPTKEFSMAREGTATPPAADAPAKPAAAAETSAPAPKAAAPDPKPEKPAKVEKPAASKPAAAALAKPAAKVEKPKPAPKPAAAAKPSAATKPPAAPKAELKVGKAFGKSAANFADLAAAELKKAGGPLSCLAMSKLVRGKVAGIGAGCSARISAAIRDEISRKGKASRFKAAATPGQYELA